MTRKNPESRKLGGIGTMLIQSEVCPACGKVHESRLLRYLPSGIRDPSLATDAAVPAARSDVASAITSPRVRRGASHGIPWTIPVYSEEQP